MKRAIREHLRDFIAIIVLGAIAVLAIAIILPHQRFSFPFLSAQPFTINAELQTAKSVSPGQGQTVQVAGVQIGRIGGVKLRDGRAIVKLDLFPKYKHLVHEDARAELRPRTGLDDMYVQIFPGSHKAPLIKKDGTIPIVRTLTPVELHQILAELDSDTRDYVQLLVNGLGNGLRNRGNDLAQAFRRFGPTVRDLARVNHAVSGEGEQLKRVVTSLSLINAELAKRPQTLSQLVDASAATFRAFASEDVNLSRSIGLLPGTLRQATRTLTTVKGFADQLGPTANALVPSARALTVANRSVLPFAREATPILRKQIRPFVREARPLVRDLRPAAIDLAAVTPKLQTSFVVLNHLFNMLGYNPQAGKGPFTKGAPAPSYLFWIAWLTHDTVNLFNVDDANGPLRPVYAAAGCNSVAGLAPALLSLGVDINKVLVGLCGVNPIAVTQGGGSGGGLLPSLPFAKRGASPRTATPSQPPSGTRTTPSTTSTAPTTTSTAPTTTTPPAAARSARPSSPTASAAPSSGGGG